MLKKIQALFSVTETKSNIRSERWKREKFVFHLSNEYQNISFSLC